MNLVIPIIVVALVYFLVRHIPHKPAFTDSSIVRSESYVARLQAIHDGSISASPARLRGWEGERDVLYLLESEGKGIVYWNVGVRYRGQKCEYDILVLCPFGVLHIEVKAYAGTYSAAAGEPLQEPNNWQKTNVFGETKETWSPVSQALRANKILARTLSTICEKNITVDTVIVFPDNGFRVEGIKDCRLPWLDAENFRKFFRAYSQGQTPHSPLSLVDMAKIATVMGQCGFEPVFYDSDLLLKEDSDDVTKAA